MTGRSSATRRRLALATLLVGLLAVTAGCSTIFGGISDSTLDKDGEYDDLRERDADVVVDVDDGEFRAVYDLNGTEELSLYRDTFTREEALDVRAMRYWYPNGTELTGSELEVSQSRSETSVEVPDGNGTLAFTGDAGRKTFDLPAYVEGSYEVILPPGHRTSNFLFGEVRPGGYDREIVDNREHLRWEDNDSDIYLRFYLSRDVPLFGGLVAVVLLLGGAGMAYYFRQVKILERRRKELGLDVEVDDSDRGPPPPGMG